MNRVYCKGGRAIRSNVLIPNTSESESQIQEGANVDFYKGSEKDYIHRTG
jgi:hypothetical protein